MSERRFNVIRGGRLTEKNSEKEKPLFDAENVPTWQCAYCKIDGISRSKKTCPNPGCGKRR